MFYWRHKIQSSLNNSETNLTRSIVVILFIQVTSTPCLYMWCQRGRDQAPRYQHISPGFPSRSSASAGASPTKQSRCVHLSDESDCTLISLKDGTYCTTYILLYTIDWSASRYEFYHIVRSLLQGKVVQKGPLVPLPDDNFIMKTVIQGNTEAGSVLCISRLFVLEYVPSSCLLLSVCLRLVISKQVDADVNMDPVCLDWKGDVATRIQIFQSEQRIIIIVWILTCRGRIHTIND